MNSSIKSGAAAIAAVTIIAITLSSSMYGQNVDWYRLWAQLNAWATIASMVAPAFFLLGAFLISSRRAINPAFFVILTGLVITAGVIGLTITQLPGLIDSRFPWLRVVGSIYIGLGAISLTILWVQELRSGMEAIRFAAIAVVIITCVQHAIGIYGGVYPHSVWLMAARAIFGILSFFFLAFVSWCIAFRSSVAPNRPPIDAARAVELICPRCKVWQTVQAGHGRCANCRLQITISLDEGVCGTCRYPLRGLTGDKCPECGTPIAMQLPSAAVVHAEPPAESP